MMTARRIRRRVRKVNPDKPIAPRSYDEEILFPIHRKLTKLIDYPKEIDILHLIHDIYAYQQQIQTKIFSLSILMNIHEQICSLIPVQKLADFVIYATNKIISRYYYGSNFGNNSLTSKPNWFLLFYHPKLRNSNDIYCKLNLISPILTVFDVDKYYNYKTNYDSFDYISLITSLIIIRQNIPTTNIKGIDYKQINDINNMNDINNDIKDDDGDNFMIDKDEKNKSKYYIQYTQLFGPNLENLVLKDLCKYICSFLDIKSFFKCSAINVCSVQYILYDL